MFDTYLPAPLIVKILSYCTQYNLSNVCLVCKLWNTTCKNQWHTVNLTNVKKVDPFVSIPLNQFSNLKILDLSACTEITYEVLTNALKIVGASLEQLVLRRCGQLEDSTLLAIAEYAPNLRNVSFAAMKKITDDGIIEMMSKTKHVAKLGLAGCTQLTDKSMKAICKNSNVRLTTIGVNLCEKITDKSLNLIQNYSTNICILSLSGLKKITSEGMQNLVSTCHQLGSIDLTSCSNIDDQTLIAISKNCPLLFQLNVSFTNITDTGVIAISNGCPKLKLLFLSRCQVTNLSVTALKDFSLEVLVLNKCRSITSTILLDINVSRMKYLDIAQTSIESALIPCHFKAIPRLLKD